MAKQKRKDKKIYVAVGCLFKRTLTNQPIGLFSTRNSDKESSEVLLIRRREKGMPELNKWELPGGKIPYDIDSKEKIIFKESAPETVKREFLEETGYSVKVRSKPFHTKYVIYREYPSFTLQVHLEGYYCELESEIPIPTNKDPKVSKIAWVSVSELPYEDVLEGSRSFIHDLGNDLGLKIKSAESIIDGRAQFYVFDSEKQSTLTRLGRKYNMTIRYSSSSPDGESILITSWGGPRKRGNDMAEIFSDREKLERRVKERIRDRVYHGYVLTTWDDFFPNELINWYRDQGYPIQKPLL